MEKKMPRTLSSSLRSAFIPALVVIFLLGIIIFLIVNRNFQWQPLGQQTGEPSALSTPAQAQINELDISVCDPTKGPFSLTIDNPFMPLPVGMVHMLESSTSKVQMSVLNQTETVAGVTTRVVEEREWTNGSLSEIARNFFVQAPDGTVCYYGEDVDEYRGGQIVGHSGAWRAGTGQNRPGIVMPSHPVVGQTYRQEVAPGVATDRAEHVAMKQTLTTPAGTFNDVLVVKETPASDKRYQRGIGMIFDDGAMLTKY
jgi:hypothetical protein